MLFSCFNHDCFCYNFNYLRRRDIFLQQLKLSVKTEKIVVENLITEIEQQNPIKETQSISNGILEIDLTNIPVFISRQNEK